jgi:hypothetical protein
MANCSGEPYLQNFPVFSLLIKELWPRQVRSRLPAPPRSLLLLKEKAFSRKVSDIPEA